MAKIADLLYDSKSNKWKVSVNNSVFLEVIEFKTQDIKAIVTILKFVLGKSEETTRNEIFYGAKKSVEISYFWLAHYTFTTQADELEPILELFEKRLAEFNSRE